MKKFIIFIASLMFVNVFSNFNVALAEKDPPAFEQDDSGFSHKGLKFKMVDENSAEVVGYESQENLDTIIIPETIILETTNASVKIVSISSGAFCNCPMKNLIFQGKIDIKREAVQACPNLKFVRFSGGIGTLEQSAFADCPELSKLRFQEGADVSYPDSFVGCGKLLSKKLQINENIELDPLRKAILNDDIAGFQDILASDPTLNVDSKVMPLGGVHDEFFSVLFCCPKAEIRKLIKGDTFYCFDVVTHKGRGALIQSSDSMIPMLYYAAMCGSEKCFKYLLANGADPQGDQEFRNNEILGGIFTLPTMAAYSGNTEILTLTKQETMNFKQSNLKYVLPALMFNIYGNKPDTLDILNWFKENWYDEIVPKTWDEEVNVLHAFLNSDISNGFYYDDTNYYPVPMKKDIEERNKLIWEFVDINRFTQDNEESYFRTGSIQYLPLEHNVPFLKYIAKPNRLNIPDSIEGLVRKSPRKLISAAIKYNLLDTIEYCVSNIDFLKNEEENIADDAMIYSSYELSIKFNIHSILREALTRNSFEVADRIISLDNSVISSVFPGEKDHNIVDVLFDRWKYEPAMHLINNWSNLCLDTQENKNKLLGIGVLEYRYMPHDNGFVDLLLDNGADPNSPITAEFGHIKCCGLCPIELAAVNDYPGRIHKRLISSTDTPVLKRALKMRERYIGGYFDRDNLLNDIQGELDKRNENSLGGTENEFNKRGNHSLIGSLCNVM